MILTHEEQYDSQRLLALMVLLYEVHNNKFDTLQEVCEQARISNHALLEQLSKYRTIHVFPDKMIFRDMCYAVYERSENDPSIIAFLEDYYSKKFPEIIKIIIKAENLPDGKEYYNQESQKLGVYKTWVITFLCYGRQKYNELGVLFSKDKLLSEDIIGYYFEYDKQIVSDASAETVFNTGESIIDSRVYKRWFGARCADLAEYLNNSSEDDVTVGNLVKYLGGLLRSRASEEDLIVYNRGSSSFLPQWLSRALITEHHGSIRWIEGVTNNGKTGFGLALNYKPDMGMLLEQYYKAVIIKANYDYKRQNKEYMSRVYLSREFKTDPEEDIAAIGYMYNMDVLIKLFEYMTEAYYKNFSWDTIFNKSQTARYEHIISGLSEQINTLQTKLDSAYQTIASIRTQTTQDNSAALIPYERENDALTRKLEQKDEEILELKRQLRSKDEYLELLLVEEPESDDEILDIDALMQKRYLFVGYDTPLMKELKRQFPSSVFMDTETYNLSGIKVDVVVMLISNMSHSMFYKVNSASSIDGLPIVRVNTRNINTVYREMLKSI